MNSYFVKNFNNIFENCNLLHGCVTGYNQTVRLEHARRPCLRVK